MSILTIGTTELIEVTGVSERQINHWCSTGVLDLEYGANGVGSRRRFTEEDVRVISVLTRIMSHFKMSMEDLETVANEVRSESGKVTVDFGGGVSLVVTQ